MRNPFRVLDMLPQEMLSKIDPETAERLNPNACPLAQATGQKLGFAMDFSLWAWQELGIGESDAWDAANDFMIWWDSAETGLMEQARTDPTQAVAERLAAFGNP